MTKDYKIYITKDAKSDISILLEEDEITVQNIPDDENLSILARTKEENPSYIVINKTEKGKPREKEHIAMYYGGTESLHKVKITKYSLYLDGGTQIINYKLNNKEGTLRIPSPRREQANTNKFDVLEKEVDLLFRNY